MVKATNKRMGQDAVACTPVTPRSQRAGDAKAGELQSGTCHPPLPADAPVQPLLKENDLVRAGLAHPAPPAIRTVSLRKIVAFDGLQYEISGATEQELAENEASLIRQIRMGTDDDPTLDAYFRGWIDRKQKTASKPVTPYRYRQTYENHLGRRLGCRRIREIRRRDVLQLQADLVDVLSPCTANQVVQLLRQILGDAVADELIPKNPALGVKRLKETGPKATAMHHRALTEDEQHWFLRSARESWYYEFFAFLLCTGLRQGEGAALVWSDIDWENGLLRISRTLSYSADGRIIVGAAKSDAGIRDIPMNETIRTLLDMQRLKLLSKWDPSATDPDSVVFPSSIGGVLHNTTANNALRKIRKLMKRRRHPVPPFTCHALRDTFATRFIEQGGNPQTLKAILGHSSLKMTMDLYAQVLPDTKKREMEMVRIEV